MPEAVDTFTTVGDDRGASIATIAFGVGVDGECVAEFGGVLCTLSVLELRREIDQLAATITTSLSMDLRGVTFIDGRGLSLLLALRKSLVERDCPCHVIDASDTVYRLLEITHLTELLTAEAA